MLTETRRKEILDQIAAQVAGLLKEKQDEIFAAYQTAFAESEAQTFRFPVGLRATIEPVGHKYIVKTRLSYSVSHACEAKATVGDPDMIEELEREESGASLTISGPGRETKTVAI